jgi:hypothetical protein
VTTGRKALTLFASFVLFPKHFGIGHPIGAMLVFGSAFVTLRRGTPNAPPPPLQSRGAATNNYGTASSAELRTATLPV